MLQNLFLFVFTTETFNFDNACYMIILCTSANDNFILHIDNMAKTNAEKQKEYRERKKLESDEFLEKERKRQKKYYVKTTQLKKKELKDKLLRNEYNDHVLRRKHLLRKYAKKTKVVHQAILTELSLP